MRWYCLCGKQLSNTLTPEPNGYDVFTAEEGENGYENPPKILAYTCPDCGRLMVFKVNPATNMFEDKIYRYAPEDADAISKEEVEHRIKEKAKKNGL